MTQFSEFLSTQRHTSKSEVTPWKYLATVIGSSPKTNRYLSSIYTDLSKLLSPCASIDWTKSETIRSPQRWPWLLHCPGGEQSKHQAFPGHYLPQLNTNYCFLRWKNHSFPLNTTEHLRHAAMSQMMIVTVDTAGMQHKMCVVTKTRSLSRQLPRLTPFYLLLREPAQELWDSCLDQHIFCSDQCDSSVVVFHWCSW